MKNFSEKEKLQLLNDYLNKYGKSYNESQINDIKNNFGISYNDYMTQIYYALNIMNDEENPYVGFTQLIEKLFGLDINILEVGGGVYPALTNEIAKRQESIGKGKITMCDPVLSKNVDIKNAELIKDVMSDEPDLSKYDLVIGKEPCYATLDLIKKSSYYNNELLVSPCKCYCLLPEYIEFDDDPVTQWYNYVKSYMKQENYDLNTHFLDDKMNYDNPIYTKTLKK